MKRSIVTQTNYLYTIFVVLLFVAAASCSWLPSFLSSESSSHPHITSHDSVHHTSEYWTQERMDAARAPYHYTETGLGRGSAEERERSERIGIACNGATQKLHENREDYNTYPFSAMGKVFFVRGGKDYVCSGTIGSDYLVWTAGHCVFDPDGLNFVTQLMFVPGYYRSLEPYGKFYASRIHTNLRWVGKQGVLKSVSKDGQVGATKAQNYALNGEWIGGQREGDYALVQVTTPFPAELPRMKIATGVSPANATYTVYGYPQEAPFSGKLINTCISSGCQRDVGQNPMSVGVTCDSTAGSSGGAWIVDLSQITLDVAEDAGTFIDTSSNTNLQDSAVDKQPHREPTIDLRRRSTSAATVERASTPAQKKDLRIAGVTSYVYGSNERMIYSPYFDNFAQTFFDTVLYQVESSAMRIHSFFSLLMSYVYL